MQPEPRLPLPGSEDPWGELVDAYTEHHGIPRQETFRRVSAQTGNSTKGLALRYRQKYDQPWWFAAPLNDLWWLGSGPSNLESGGDRTGESRATDTGVTPREGSRVAAAGGRGRPT